MGAMKALAMKAVMKAAMKVKAMKAKPMKAMKAMKTMKKVKKVSKIARGKYAKAAVLRGSKEKTSAGLTKDSLMKNRMGKVVSRKASAVVKKRFAAGPLKKWCEAVKQARKEMKIVGFRPIGGVTAEGKQLLAKVRSILAKK